MTEQLYLTANLPGIGGELKRHPHDFRVEEIPLYLPSGEGQHLYIEIEKEGLPTFAAIKQIAKALQVSPKSIGYAGLKDAQAITRQTISLDNISAETVAQLELPNIKILQAKRHTNKLRIGHLTGNRFEIRVREVEEAVIPQTEAMLNILAERGVPNFFGTQRFGNRNNTDRLGEMLVRQNVEEFVAEYLGRPMSHETPVLQEARRLVDEGAWQEALAQWPPYLREERKTLAMIANSNGQFDKVFKSVPKRLRTFFVSAFQSKLFNQLLSDRLTTLDQLETGDVAYIHRNGAAFIVQDAIIEQPRADAFDISPSGPMFGYKTLLAEEKPGEWERALLAEHQLTLKDFNLPGMKLRGGRRPYRFKLQQPRVWWDEGLMISFELPPGAYATTVMAEIMKPE